MNTQFYCREQKVNKQGLAPIELSIVINKKRTYITLDYRVAPKDFIKAVNSKRTNEVKDFISLIQNKLNNAVLTLMQYNVPLTIESVKNAFKNGYSTSYTVSDLFNDYLGILKNDKSQTIPNIRKYEMARDIFFECVNSNAQANTITNADILNYQTKVYNKFKESTAASYMTKLKTFIKFGVDNQKMQNNPFSGIKISSPKYDIEIISQADYNKLKEAELTDTLDRARDFLILMANSGMAFGDLIRLEREDLINVGDYYVVSKKRNKTGVKFDCIILPDGVDVLEKYNFDISCLKYSNSYINRNAKTLQEDLEINSVASLRTHLMRHFYITSLIRKGVNITTVQRCAGHSDIKMTLRYTHLITEDIVNSYNRDTKPIRLAV